MTWPMDRGPEATIGFESPPPPGKEGALSRLSRLFTGAEVGFTGHLEQRCQCGGLWGPIPGRAGIQGCLEHPLELGHDVMVERAVGGSANVAFPAAPEAREASQEAQEALGALRDAGTAFLAALTACDAALHREVAQDGPSVLAGLQSRVHGCSDGFVGDAPQGPVPLQLAVRDLVRTIQEVTQNA